MIGLIIVKDRILSIALCLMLVLGLFPATALASTDWPVNVSIESDAGIIMDAHSGAVVYGKNIHSTYAPASITKVLTALIILENCSLDDTVTFSQNAVYNVEADSSSAGYDTGDQASVKDCLYALLLKSANESANALAEHLSGSTEAFAELMNQKAAELGCQDSHFANPSGLNDENHYVSAYDMALITRAACNHDTFLEIVATTYYNLPPNKQNPEGQGISPGNKMVKPNWPDQYRADVIGGKTGYTSIALNTLVIGAEQGDTKFVTVILHSQATQYDDTKRLLDFGFNNFRSIRIEDYDTTYSSIGDNLKIAGLPTSDKPALTVDSDSRVILPTTADFSETSAVLDYTLPEEAPEGAIAVINYSLGERPVGQAYLTLSDTAAETGTTLPEALIDVQPSALAPAAQIAGDDTSAASLNETGESSKTGASLTAPAAQPEEKNEEKKPGISLKIPSLFWKILAVLAVIGILGGGSVYYITARQKKEEAERLMRRKRRTERLKDTGVSETEFELMMQDRRNKTAPPAAEKKKRKRS